MKYFLHCTICRNQIHEDDLPPSLPEAYANVFLNRKLKGTYCTRKCFLKHFRKTKRDYYEKFIFWKIKKSKTFYIKRKEPRKKYKVIFIEENFQR